MPGDGTLRRELFIVAIIVTVFGQPSALRAQARGAEHEGRVGEAIEKGADVLRKDLRSLLNGPGDYPMGRIALCLTALLETGMPSDHRLVERTLDALEDLPLEKTYSVACYLFALDAYWQQRLRESAANPGEPRNVGKHVISGRIREKLERLTEWLVEARQDKKGAWGYDEVAGRIDNSNTQFAMLGLSVAIKHGIEVKEKVLVEIVRYLLGHQKKQGKPFRLVLTPEAAFSPLTSPGETDNTTITLIPGGWPYQRGSSSPSMTAAGASNLLVARDGLQRLRRGNSAIVSQLERSLYVALAWISSNMDAFVKGTGSYYYTLYSLEKVGDLAGIREFNGRDWYYEGCRALLKRQNDGGGWGQGRDRHVRTSFALLFMTRATRPYQDVGSAPRILTGPGRPDSKDASDRVYVDSLDGFISARGFFYYLARRRDRKTIKIGKEVVSNYANDRKEELIPLLAMLWGRHSDIAARFARDSLETITGVRDNDRDFYLKWHRDSLSVTGLFSAGTRDPVEVGRVLSECEGIALKTRVLDLIEREELTETCLDLVDELLEEEDAYRRRVHALLERFTNVSVPAPESKSRREWREAHSRWFEWINGETGRVLFRFARLRRVIVVMHQPDRDQATSSSQIEELVQFGQDAIPAILDTMKRGAFCTDLVVALERLTGEYRGVAVEAWERWWQENG